MVNRQPTIEHRRPLTRFERVNILLQTLREELGTAVEEVSTPSQSPVLKMLEKINEMIEQAKKLARRQMIDDELG